MEKKGMEIEWKNWVKRMGILSDKNSSVIFKKLRNDERIMVLLKRVVKDVRPTYEVEHIRKNLALKKVAQKMELRQKLAEKEEEVNLKDHDFEQLHLKLRVLSCKIQEIKQKTKDLKEKILLLCCKKQDLKNKLKMYEKLYQVANFFQEPVQNGSGDTRSSLVKHMEITCQHAIFECELQIHELHKLYNARDTNIQILHSRKESLMAFVRHRMKNIPILHLWNTMMILTDKLNDELHSLTLNSVTEDPEHLQALRLRIDRVVRKFMKSHLEVFKVNHSLKLRVMESKSEREVLLERVTEMLQEKLCGRVPDEKREDADEIRNWLQLQMKLVELDAIKTVLKMEMKNSKSKHLNVGVLTVQEDEIKKLDMEIERLQNDISIYYIWFRKSCAEQEKVEINLKQDISKFARVCTEEECAAKALDMLRNMKGVLQEELMAFKDFPLNVLDNVALPLGTVLPNHQQVLKYRNHLGSIAQSHELTDILAVVDGAPSATPHSIVRHLVEKKLYLNFLKTTQPYINELCSSLDVLDISLIKNTENVAVAHLNEAVHVVEQSIEEGKMRVQSAKDNFNAWVEHPQQRAVPDKLEIDEKHFKEWQYEYESLLVMLDDL